ncbi:hypothetical protein [Mitsuokella multacida]|uniref:hypothetical protein n=1 Tax=Mitsuokella multacida TaxID=52226 RepID=UPI00241EFBBB|nr:hypothetical protein [Mitsuokella multacida]
MDAIKNAIAALRADTDLTDLIGANNLYHQRAPKVCKYPAVIYSLVSSNPSLSGDNTKLYNRIRIRFHILTKAGSASYNPVTAAITKIMTANNWVEGETVEMMEDDDIFVRVIDFIIQE